MKWNSSVSMRQPTENADDKASCQIRARQDFAASAAVAADAVGRKSLF